MMWFFSGLESSPNIHCQEAWTAPNVADKVITSIVARTIAKPRTLLSFLEFIWQQEHEHAVNAVR